MNDATMGAAAHTLLPAGGSVATIALTITYLRAVRQGDMPVTVTARAANQTRSIVYVLGALRGREDGLVAHAVENFLTLVPDACATVMGPGSQSPSAKCGVDGTTTHCLRSSVRQVRPAGADPARDRPWPIMQFPANG